MVTHHLVFLEACLEASITPKGFKLQPSPQIYKARTSNIADKIATILGDAEKCHQGPSDALPLSQTGSREAIKTTESQMPSSLFSPPPPPPPTPSPTKVSKDIAAFAQALRFRNSPYPYSRHPYKPLPPSPSLLPPSLPLSPGQSRCCIQ